MRFFVTCCLLLGSAFMVPVARASLAPASAANLVRLHPGPWRLPAPAASAIRFDPETGAPATADDATRRASDAASVAQAQAAARARAAATVRRSADGALHAVLGTAFRHWTVARVDEAGRVRQDCVDSDVQAQALVGGGAKQGVRK